MSDRKPIKIIYGMEPKRDGELPVCHWVGHDGVTTIEYRLEEYGDHGIAWFDVFKGSELHASMQARAVAEIIYQKPAQ